jgi:hypothetical protein
MCMGATADVDSVNVLLHCPYSGVVVGPAMCVWAQWLIWTMSCDPASIVASCEGSWGVQSSVLILEGISTAVPPLY